MISTLDNDNEKMPRKSQKQTKEEVAPAVAETPEEPTVEVRHYTSHDIAWLCTNMIAEKLDQK